MDPGASVSLDLLSLSCAVIFYGSFCLWRSCLLVNLDSFMSSTAKGILDMDSVANSSITVVVVAISYWLLPTWVYSTGLQYSLQGKSFWTGWALTSCLDCSSEALYLSWLDFCSWGDHLEHGIIDLLLFLAEGFGFLTASWITVNHSSPWSSFVLSFLLHRLC